LKSPIISVIMPVFNVEKYLSKSVGSVLRQTYQNLEIILVNDGSTDNSPTMCDEYANQDSRVKVIHKQNGGQSEARNIGLEKATGEYIYFLDSDDYIADTTIEECLTVAEREQVDFVFFDAECIFENESDRDSWDISYRRKRKYETNEGYRVLISLQSNWEYTVPPPGMFIRTKYLNSIKLKFYNGIIHEDELWAFQLYFYAMKVAHINKPLYFRRIAPGSTMTTRISSRNFIGVFTVFFELLKIYKVNEFSPDKLRLIRKFLVRTVYMCARYYMKISRSERLKIKAERKILCQEIKEMQYFNSFKVRLTCIDSVIIVAITMWYIDLQRKCWKKHASAQ